MKNERSNQSPMMEPGDSVPQHLLCWKSVAAGVLISLMAYMLLTSLGAGVEGLTAEKLATHQDSTAGLSVGATSWLVISAAIALFCGSYFTMRISGFLTNRVGAAHGFVVASIFFILLNATTGMNGFFFGRATTDISHAVADMGWSLFASFLLGLISAVVGGRTGAHANVSRPFATHVAPRRETQTYVSANI